MHIEYKTRSLEQICIDVNQAEKKHGRDLAYKIHQRIDQIRSSETVEEMIQYRIGRCHELKGNRKHQYAMDLNKNYRLIFTKEEDETNSIQIARIEEITDYH